MSPTSLARLGALALVSALALSACGGADDDAAPVAASAPDSASGSPSASGTAGFISPKLPKEPTFSNKTQGVISDVKLDTCGTARGPVSAKGTATNSGKFQRDIVVDVAWTSPAGGDVLAKAIAVVEDLAPGKSADWSVKTTLDADAQVQCVITATAGQTK